MLAIYREENGQYILDCENAVWSTDAIHRVYQQAGIHLNDVDFVIETESSLLLVEYKNARISNAVHPEAFQPESEKKYSILVRKYYDSLHFLHALGKQRPRQYVVILEYPNGDYVSRRRIRDRLVSDLPFRLHTVLGVREPVIEEVAVLSLDEWNDHPDYGKYPFRMESPEHLTGGTRDEV